MGSEWRTVRLGHVVDINPDAIASDWPFRYMMYLDISSVGEGIVIESPRLMSLAEAPSRAKRLVRKGDTILSTVRPNRRSMFFVRESEPDLVVSTGFAVLRPRPEMIDPRYLYACVFDKAFTDYLVSREKGAAYPAVLSEDIAEATINLPPLPEQRAIAHILGTLDDKIELNRRMSETLEQMARALFKSWFIDFEPVRRNAARARNQPSPGASRHPLPEGEDQYRAGYDFSGLVETARNLRRKQTPAEEIFWQLVRNRRFLGLKFRRQHQLGDYLADFYCHEHRLVVEFDGGVHKTKQKKDHKRDAWMAAQGFRVLRFPNEQLLDAPETVLSAVAAAIHHQASPPSPPGRRVGDEGSVEELDRLFPDRLVDSELGPIPEGWRVGRFADTIEIIGGGTPKTSVAGYWGGDIPWFSVVDAPTDSEVWVLDTVKKITRAGVENSSTRVLPVGTTIISARGTVGRVALVGVPMAMNQSCYGLKGLVGRQGFFNYYATRELVARLQQHAHGSVFATITRDTLAGVSVVLPPSELVEYFEKRVGPSLNRIRAGLLESRTLAAIRDALLPKLISGELRVKDAEKFLTRRGL